MLNIGADPRQDVGWCANSRLSFGDTDASGPGNPFRFNDKRLDLASNTIDMGFRRYGPDTGRFLENDWYADALDDLDLADDPLTQTHYGYAGGNPINFVDIDGHTLESVSRGGRAWKRLRIQRRNLLDRLPCKTLIDPLTDPRPLCFRPPVRPNVALPFRLQIKAVPTLSSLLGRIGPTIVFRTSRGKGGRGGIGAAIATAASEGGLDAALGAARQALSKLPRSVIERGAAELHHRVPQQILRILEEQGFPDVARTLRGVRGNPNRVPLPRDIHRIIHSGAPRGGIYNAYFRAQIREVIQSSGRITTDDVIAIRDTLLERLGLTQYSALAA